MSAPHRSSLEPPTIAPDTTGEAHGGQRRPGDRRPEPVLTARTLAEVMARVRAAGPGLRRVSLESRIDAIDRAAARWLTQGSRWRRRALAAVPRTTGLPEAVVSLAIDSLWDALRAPALRRAIRAEWPVAPLDGQPPDVRALADSGGAPALAFHSLAGNVPGVGVFGMIAALLAGVPSLVKAAAREPVFPVLVARSIAAEDARLGAALAVLRWRGGDEALDRMAVAGTDLTLAYGRDDTLATLATWHPRRLLRFGTRLSLGLVAHEAVDARTAGLAARQTALYDQQGCLSPQLIVVEESDPAATDRFTEALASELARLDALWPRAPLELAESTAVWRLLEEQRWRAQEGHALRILVGPDDRFGVVCNRTGTPVPSPLFRHLVVVPVRTLADAAPLLAPMTGRVEAVGYAGHAHRLAEVTALAHQCGAHRVCALERLQEPPFSWRQSGYPRLAVFLPPSAKTRDPGILDPGLAPS